MPISVSKWIADNHIAIDLSYGIELVKDYSDVIEEIKFEDDGEIYSVYKGLDCLFISEGLYCNLFNNACDTVCGRSHFVYLMGIYNKRGAYTGVAKVGVSKFPDRRCEALTDAWKRKGWTFKIDAVSRGVWSKRRMYELESAIHLVLRFKGLQYVSSRKYDGFSELFTCTEKDLEAIRWMLRK